MPINKFLKNLFIEIVLCFTIAILAGHLTTSFWERYVVQKELCNMKDNLRRLKVTVNHIENAYDNLHNELIGLAGTKQQKRPLPRHNVKFSQKNVDMNTAKTLHYEIIKEVNNEKNWKPIVHKEMGIMSNSYNNINNNDVRDVSTTTNNSSKTTVVKVEPDQGPYGKSRYSCKLKNSHESHEYYKTCGCCYE